MESCRVYWISWAYIIQCVTNVVHKSSWYKTRIGQVVACFSLNCTPSVSYSTDQIIVNTSCFKYFYLQSYNRLFTFKLLPTLVFLMKFSTIQSIGKFCEPAWFIGASTLKHLTLYQMPLAPFLSKPNSFRKFQQFTIQTRL